MRRDCRHFYRRSTKDGSAVEGCALDEAPDAPLTCPSRCPWFEKRTLSTTGFVYGSLAPSAAEQPGEELSPVDEALLDDLRDLLDTVGPSVIEADSEQREAERRRQARKQRRRLF